MFSILSFELSQPQELPMNGLKQIAAAGLPLLLLCQCASQEEIRQLNYQLRSMNQKVEKIESKTEEKIKEVDDQVLKGTANSSSKLDSVAEETRQLKAVNEENIERFDRYKAETEDRIASLQAALEQTRTENDQLSKSNEELVRSLEMKIEQLSSGLQQASMGKMQEAERQAREAEMRAQDAAEKAAEARRKAEAVLKSPPADDLTLQPESRKARRGGEDAPSQEEAAPQVQDEPKDGDPVELSGSSGKTEAAPAASEEFERAMTRFKEKNYKGAYKLFEQSLSGQPGDEQAAKALYLMGECQFNQGEYDLAILDYQKVITNYSGDPHSAAALLRQGMAFEKLTDKETAKMIYTKLNTEYPDSREAKLAKDRLEKLQP
jgi:tol-pal system protein YbgF